MRYMEGKLRYIPGDFVSAPNRHIIKGQKSYIQAVYFWICDMANDRGLCWPAISTIARDAGCGETSVKEALRFLIAKKILTKHSGAESGKSNTYEIHIIEENRVTN